MYIHITNKNRHLNFFKHILKMLLEKMYRFMTYILNRVFILHKKSNRLIILFSIIADIIIF